MRDLAEWIVELCERGVGGTFNATHPGFTWGELLETCRAVAGANSTITWVPTSSCSSTRSASGWSCRSGSPTLRWQRPDEVDVRRALAEGLRFRRARRTRFAATLEAAETTDAAGLTPEREAELLAAWHAR